MSDEPKPAEPQVRVVDRRWWARQAAGETADTETPRKPTYVEELERRIADQAEQLQTFITEHRRALDEFEQAKVRIRRDMAREVERGRRAVLVELLEIVDNLDRAITAARETGPADVHDALDNLARGIELVRDQFLAKLDAFGVARVPALGQPFDATRHEAVTIAPVDNPSQDGVIIAVVREGYAIADELLRPASVVVGRRTT